MSHLTKQALGIIEDYKSEHGTNVIDLEEVTNWAIIDGRYEAPREALARDLRKLLSRALREVRVTDPQGRKVRKYHAVKEEKNGHTLWLWGDKDEVGVEHMKTSFFQRRKEIVNDCCSLKVDVDSYNDNNRDGAWIQMSFSMDADVTEAELGDATLNSSSNASKRPSARSHLSARRSTSSHAPSHP